MSKAYMVARLDWWDAITEERFQCAIEDAVQINCEHFYSRGEELSEGEAEEVAAVYADSNYSNDERPDYDLLIWRVGEEKRIRVLIEVEYVASFIPRAAALELLDEVAQ